MRHCKVCRRRSAASVGGGNGTSIVVDMSGTAGMSAVKGMSISIAGCDYVSVTMDMSTSTGTETPIEVDKETTADINDIAGNSSEFAVGVVSKQTVSAAKTVTSNGMGSGLGGAETDISPEFAVGVVLKCMVSEAETVTGNDMGGGVTDISPVK